MKLTQQNHILPPPQESSFKGIPASPGLALGQAFVFLQKEPEVPQYSLHNDQIPSEIKRLEAAYLKTRNQLTHLRSIVSQNLGEKEAEIFDAHLLVLDDKALIDEALNELHSHSYNIDYCFHTVSQRYIDAFSKIDDDYIKERSSDIKDVARRVLDNLLGLNEFYSMKFEDSRVLIADDITPSQTIEIQKNNVLAIITNNGSQSSHSAIMARSLKIPAIVGLNNITNAIQSDDTILVDGYEGILYLNPSHSTLQKYEKIKQEKSSLAQRYQASLSLPSSTKDNSPFSLSLNLDSFSDLHAASSLSPSGVGLFRTESLFLNKNDHIPNEEEQFLAYKSVVDAFPSSPITFRTIDIGGDKNIPGHKQSHENNPFLGFRAIRFCLENKNFFKSQLRAILRASALYPGNLVQIMYPMISGPHELIAANSLLNESKTELASQNIPFNPNIPVGCMIEIPSAALTLDILAHHVHFFSIGTNDLIQYLLAVDRVNERIAHLYQPHHPAVLRILHAIIHSANKLNKPISVCGEMAADPIYTSLLLGLGLSSFSVNPSSFPEIKYWLANLSLSHSSSLASSLLSLKDPDSILRSLREFHLSLLPSPSSTLP